MFIALPCKCPPAIKLAKVYERDEADLTESEKCSILNHGHALALQTKFHWAWFWFRDIEGDFSLALADTPQLGDSLHMSFRLAIDILTSISEYKVLVSLV